MEGYSIFFKKSVEKDLDGIPKSSLTKILQRIEALKIDPRPRGSEKLTGQELYRIRQGLFRIVYSIQDRELTIWIIRIAHRREIYRKLR
ncbi:type II toxin-antitoxin system RelE/ParE family toxin [Desulfoprunum benzoelyticum]|uniref:mRNA interferase RelE/StbE n=1 Tax=Desulfoprunum benzoelyticum TaxID=1506996 RepID=A0A840V1V8_9BACT|nr:mRNA interferase RelE/StbE [Desulfoprunum benzoelyticum]MBM9529292.1 type II toxin-antitoxin system RelE/ParE family toxin [Desulfoprunum benzoelyticum]